MSWDAVIIGASPEGLAASVTLAREGFKVLVVDEAATPGGAHAADEFHPGFTAPGLHHDLPLSPHLFDYLDLGSHGLEAAAPPAIRVGEVTHAGDLTSSEGPLSTHGAWLARPRKFLHSVATSAPPPIAAEASAWPALAKAFALRRLGAGTLNTLLRRGPLSLRDYLEELEVRGPAAASVALTGLAGSRLGPFDPITTPGLLFRAVTAASEAVGGGAGLVDSLVSAAEAAGVTLRTGVSVQRVRVGPLHADGVEIDGAMQETRTVFVAGAPEPLLARWLDPLAIPPELEQPLEGWRARGDIAIVQLALSAPLAVDGEPVARLRTATSLVQLERARDAVKYRGVSEAPPLDARQWSLSRPELAPEGHHVVTVHAHGVSLEATRSFSEEDRAALGERVVALLDDAAPGLAKSVLAQAVLTPADLEARGLQGGHLWHGEITLDQSWVMRPSRRLSQYSTPIPGLFLCSAATHPSPFALGGSGIEAAEAALE